MFLKSSLLWLGSMVLAATALPLSLNTRSSKPSNSSWSHGISMQPLDHFDNNNNQTIPIRYWVDDTYYQPGGPVIFVNFGEETVTNESVDYVFQGPQKIMAKSLGALSILLEHRYIGQSVPSSVDPKNPSYRYLTVNQSLADMANFIKSSNGGVAGVHQDLSPPNTKWIARGGSYSGVLSAWMRYQYPDLVYAAMSSSAPVQGKLDFYEYHDAFIQYGDQYCVGALHNVVEIIDGFFAGNPTESKKIELKRLFGLPAETNDVAFAIQVPGLLAFQWQSTTPVDDPTGQMCKDAFKGATNAHDQFNNYAAYFKEQMSQANAAPASPVSGMWSHKGHYRKTNNIHSDNNPSSSSGSNSPYTDQLMWDYLTCNEFGFFQDNSPPVNSPYYDRRIMTNLTSDQVFLSDCQNEFPGQLPSEPSLGYLNQHYQGWDLELTRTIWVNGEYDPWRYLGVASSDAPPRANTSTQYSILLPHGGHCFDFQPYPGYQNSINNLMEFAAITFKSWLAAL
ncbi:peptidase S28 [Hesseltinella vesiculosa]|uniref:Peptidase S28 n=1 Tax=Hesseltinella vesiculosa TaxID=101127 RepID=A0A1X2G670_9FUNG|nr:peptidase S28 [Hesseltinella vesiculosa]